MFKKLSILILSLFLLSCGDGLTYEQKINDYNLYISKADSLFQISNYEEAIKYANTAISITDTLSSGFIKKGNACYELGWLDFAEENFDKAIKIEGETSKVYTQRALVHLKNKNSKFLKDINIYLERHPNDEEAIELRRDYYEEKNHLDNAIEEYTIAINKDPSNADLIVKRSELHYKNGNWDKTLEDYGTILKLEPNNELVTNKKREIERLINDKSNRNKFILLLLGIYLIYLPISFFVLKPLVAKKALKQIGGSFTMRRDPLVWILPIVLSMVFITLYFTNLIPNFK